VGHYIVWIGEADNSEGNVDVYLDGVFRTTVNCYSTTRLTQQRLFTATNLSPGRHALKLVKKSGSLMVVDAFAVVPTPPAPAAPAGLTVGGETNGAVLSWTASPGATGYNVKRATLTGGPYVTVTSLGATNYNDLGLTAGTTYFYVVSATNNSGESANSAEFSAITASAVTQGIPAAPTGLTLKLANLQTVLSWKASTGAASYNVKRAAISGGPYTIVTNVTGTADADAGLSQGTTYYYVLSAVNACGESADSPEAAVTTVAAGGLVYQNTVLGDQPLGYWPLDLTSDTNTDGSGNLLASDLSGHGNTGTYRFITAAGNHASGPSIFLPNAVSFDGVTTYVDLSTGSNTALLNISGKITMEAWAAPASSSTYGDIMGNGYDSALNSDELEMRANDGNYHGGVFNWTINDQGVTGGSETTNWTHVVCTYDGTSWNLYLNGVKTTSAASTSGALVFGDPWAIGSGTVDGLNRIFTGHLCQAALYATALTSAQVSTHYSRGRYGQTPAPPAGITAAGHNGHASLSWSPSVGATTYYVKRSTVAGGAYTPAGSVAGTGYVDTGLVNGTAYYYVVAAGNSAGTSGNSVETKATPVAAISLTLSPQLQTGGFSFSFTGQSNQSFVVETSTNLMDWMAVLTNVSADGQFIFSGVNATDSARYYRVRQ
jgi:fibronectin type 3 domain-containing protein